MDLLVLLLFSSALVLLRASASSSALVLVKGSAQVSCNMPCPGEVKVMYAKGSELLVTRCQQGSCVEGDAFKNRTQLTFVPRVGLCLQLNEVQYSDEGIYTFYCDGSWLCRQTLDVFASVPAKAAVGEDVIIPCHAHTRKNIADQDITCRWEKDGQLVLQLQQGRVTYAPAFKGRVSVSPDAYRTGDLSLNISNVRQSDGGTYRCTHRDEEPGQPEAVTLNVTASPSTVPGKDAKNCCTPGAKLGICWSFCGILLVLLGFASYFLFYKKKAQDKPGGDDDDDDDDDDPDGPVLLKNPGQG